MIVALGEYTAQMIVPLAGEARPKVGATSEVQVELVIAMVPVDAEKYVLFLLVAPDEVLPQEPLLTPSAPKVIVFAVDDVPVAQAARAVPDIVRLAPMAAAAENVLFPDPDKVRLLKVMALLPPILCAKPSKLNVLPVFVKVPPLFVQSPATLCV